MASAKAEKRRATASRISSSFLEKCRHSEGGVRWAIRLATFLGWFFAGAGVMRLLPVPFDVELFASWGLPVLVNGLLALGAFAGAWATRSEVLR